MSDSEIVTMPDAPRQLDVVSAKAIESFVIKGDISGMSPSEKTRYYTQMCESLGLNPATQPMQILKLNGKEILYMSKGATDQLAAIHKLNREIIDGPKVIDLAGTQMVYAVCKATHPNGRAETAVATVPLNDPLNVLMKCETKAKRRATLSILGLGMLDESELESIPARQKETVAQIRITQTPRRDELADVLRACRSTTELESLRQRIKDEVPIADEDRRKHLAEVYAEMTNRLKNAEQE